MIFGRLATDVRMYSVARIRRLGVTCHLLEKGKLDGPLAVSCGVERAGATAFHSGYGRSVDEIVEDHQRYALRVEALRAVPIQVALDEITKIE